MEESSFAMGAEEIFYDKSSAESPHIEQEGGIFEAADLHRVGNREEESKASIKTFISHKKAEQSLGSSQSDD